MAARKQPMLRTTVAEPADRSQASSPWRKWPHAKIGWLSPYFFAVLALSPPAASVRQARSEQPSNRDSGTDENRVPQR